MTAVCIGHGDCFGVSDQEVRHEAQKMIERGVTEFLNGGMGQFDWKCAKVIHDLKEEYPNVAQSLVIPYLDFNVREKKYFDEFVYPEGFERYPYKAAIPARNRYMVDHAQFALCYVTHGWGGAAQTYDWAVKKKLTIANLGER